MKYIKTYENYGYTEDYDLVIYPGNKTYLRINSELKEKLLAVINGTLEFYEVQKDQYGDRDLKIYKQDDNIVFQTKEGAKLLMEIEDILLLFN